MARTKVGITGGIGSGKTYVCGLLAQRGLPVYDCDTEAKHLMTQSESLRSGIAQLVGNEAYTHDEESGAWLLNKPIVAQYLFSDKAHAAAIDALVHPAVKADFLRWAGEQDCDIVVQESAILFESGFDATVDYTIHVYAPIDLRIQRAMQRDSATAQQVQARISQQMDDNEKRLRADFCIVNDGRHDLNTQIDEILNTITNKVSTTISKQK